MWRQIDDTVIGPYTDCPGLDDSYERGDVGWPAKHSPAQVADFARKSIGLSKSLSCAHAPRLDM